jgi:sialic acid synthase SpsE
VERPVAAVVRRSLFWARPLAAGANVSAADLVALRPASGLAPRNLDRLVGGRTTRAVAAGDAVTDDDVAVERGAS